MSLMNINVSVNIGKGAAIGNQAGAGAAIAVGEGCHASGSSNSSKSSVADGQKLDEPKANDLKGILQHTDAKFDIPDPLPTPLLDFLDELCRYCRDSSDSKKITIVGVNAKKNTTSSDLHEAKQLLKRSTTLAEDLKDVPVFSMQRPVTIYRRGMSELVVNVIERNSLGEIIQKIPHAVGSAHIMFDTGEYDYYCNLPNAAEELRDKYNRMSNKPPFELVYVQAADLKVTTSQPIMLGFRKKYQPEGIPPMANDNQIEYNLCLNDIVLQPVRDIAATFLDQRIQESRPSSSRGIVDVPTLNILKLLYQPSPGFRVFIKGFYGDVYYNQQSYELYRQFGEAYALWFNLDDGELVPGDSGSIVYLREEDEGTEVLTPFGIFAGQWGVCDDIERRPPKYYAAILRIALTDIARAYSSAEATYEIEPFIPPN